MFFSLYYYKNITDCVPVIYILHPEIKNVNTKNNIFYVIQNFSSDF